MAKSKTQQELTTLVRQVYGDDARFLRALGTRVFVEGVGQAFLAEHTSYVSPARTESELVVMLRALLEHRRGTSRDIAARIREAHRGSK